jgi:chromosome segregation ATPase
MNTTQAISELQKFLSFKRASEHAEDVLQKLHDAEQEVKDAEKLRDKLKAEAEAIGKANEKAKGIIADAEEKALEIVSQAQQKAEAENVLNIAKKEAASITAKAQADLEKLTASIKSSEQELQGITIKISAASTELDEMEKAKEKAKKALKNFVGD